MSQPQSNHNSYSTNAANPFVVCIPRSYVNTRKRNCAETETQYKVEEWLCLLAAKVIVELFSLANTCRVQYFMVQKNQTCWFGMFGSKEKLKWWEDLLLQLEIIKQHCVNESHILISQEIITHTTNLYHNFVWQTFCAMYTIYKCVLKTSAPFWWILK